MTSPIKAALAAGESVGALWLGLGNPSVAEMAADAGPDCVIFDAQHGLWTRQTLEAGIGHVRGRVPALVRTADNTLNSINQALDAGAVGVIVPLVETAEEAAFAVAAAKYPPDGNRSAGGLRPIMNWKPYVASANSETLVGVMIETKRGLENARAIAATPGLDLVFIGTTDLALSLGVFPDNGPVHEAALMTILAACREAGIACGAFTGYAPLAALRRSHGFQMTVVADDGSLLHAHMKQAVARFRPGKPFSLAGRTALVTGANRGIGVHLVQGLLDHGVVRVYAAARDPASVNASDGRVVPLALDVTSSSQVRAAARQCRDVDLLINNAGVNFNTGLLVEGRDTYARREMEVNYFGTLAMTRAFAPVLKRNRGGILVNMLSILARQNLPAMGSLCASKAAALSLTQATRAELAAQKTHVVAVLPGAVDTDMTRDFQGPKVAPAQVAAEILDGLERGLEEIYPTEMAAGVATGLALDPQGTERMFQGFLPGPAVAARGGQ
ncbi:MAG: SDR family NAD(P)-dependent oxidoreductase [Alphaproteobacteria bacterium]|nr:MAG: SDR family NAD(P)-dependent oxidoreductase [Alphaproteobacteria bacterium]